MKGYNYILFDMLEKLCTIFILKNSFSFQVITSLLKVRIVSIMWIILLNQPAVHFDLNTCCSEKTTDGPLSDVVQYVVLTLAVMYH